jgi:hypothetical protein
MTIPLSSFRYLFQLLDQWVRSLVTWESRDCQDFYSVAEYVARRAPERLLVEGKCTRQDVVPVFVFGINITWKP